MGRWACAVGGRHGDPPSPVSAFPRAEQGEARMVSPAGAAPVPGPRRPCVPPAQCRRGPFLGEGGNVLPGLRVVPAQLSVLPPDEEIERDAEALQYSFFDSLDGDWFVSATLKPVPGQTGSVQLPGLVEPPVLGDAEGGVGRPLLHLVTPYQPGRLQSWLGRYRKVENQEMGVCGYGGGGISV